MATPKNKIPQSTRVVFLGLLLAALTLGGCQSVKGVMYLHPKRVGDHLAKTNNSLTETDYIRQRRKWIRKIPDGNRILGGFCTDKQVLISLKKLRKLAVHCSRRTHGLATRAGLQNSLFWGFLLSTAAAGAGMIITGIAIQDAEAKGWTSFAFGATTFTLAMITGLGGFDGRQSVLNMRAKKVDNFMWTMRLRVIAEVCNAKSVRAARQQMAQLARDTKRLCITEPLDNGYYTIPDRADK